MIVKQYIKDFEKLGFGMFIHFGLYSMLGRGEWCQRLTDIPNEEYEACAKTFNPKPDWAIEIVKLAKTAGCKYITLTTRHHDGYSLFDTCGLNDYDAPHSCGRDLVREFVDACRAYDIIPFFYHTLYEWHEPSYREDFPTYLEYLRSSVELLCKNYGKIGGIWFDGSWAKPIEMWEEDKLYSLIRKYQPDAMIINNTGLSARGELGHIELDSVTFERGKPQLINMEGAPKYVASEMCETLCRHWGYTQDDWSYKGPAQMICELADCRRYGSNMLLNVGPLGDGTVPPLDAAIFEMIGRWVNCFDEAIRAPRPCGIEVQDKENDFILKDGKNYYLFCYGLPMISDPNVAISEEDVTYIDRFKLSDKISSVTWMDNGVPLEFAQVGDDVKIHTEFFKYSRQLVVRVAKIVCE